MRYVFLITLENGHEERVGFFAESEEQAREKAVAWAEGGTVLECVERWAVDG